jgi:hypothetical protein
MALHNHHLHQKIQALPPEMQREVLDFVEFLAAKHLKASSHNFLTDVASPLSAYDLAQQIDCIGSFSGPVDLSTNPAYFEDFGK